MADVLDCVVIGAGVVGLELACLSGEAVGVSEVDRPAAPHAVGVPPRPRRGDPEAKMVQVLGPPQTLEEGDHTGSPPRHVAGQLLEGVASVLLQPRDVLEHVPVQGSQDRERAQVLDRSLVAAAVCS